ncbi:Glycylpeptide N-tetradecanoyltransferase [Polychaeton citri CBS 116435]|uniref:Glycylpeptide N-tetradecanoyltransferase n=1 Tax=Polychaeton citri CBS 116435 TaxID=1314669 RepID=A0A9P4QDA5_9PEZI|nr:Glycylpeptide N-tetradecanoyltransferase [Polychaeton citri CBS 116435]
MAEQNGESSKPELGGQDIRQLLQQLALSEADQGASEGKKQEDYKFWNTQPVPKFTEQPNLLQTTDDTGAKEGAILPDKICRLSAKPNPEKLLDGFEWCLVDLTSKDELKELYDLLFNHYVEDKDGSFRFNYSIPFLEWALKPPGWTKEWHIGVRTASKDGKKGKLVAFIAGVPVKLKVNSNTINASEINFLTIHRKLRSKRLAPVLIKEVTRKCYLSGVFQALYTAGTLLPTPVSTCRYFHRSLDWEHLYRNGFSHMPPGSNETRQKLRYKLPQKPLTKGFRAMQEADIPAVLDLLQRYIERFSLRQEFNEAEIRHWLCSESSKDVVWSFVVEDGEGKVTDFVSYYLLESTVLKANSTTTTTIRAAYLYYYASTVAFTLPSPSADTNPENSKPLATRLQALIHDALIMARNDGFHVFNALTLLENPLFLKEQRFEPGDGKLHYYLFNWRTPRLASGVNEAMQIDVSKMGGVGVVML